MKEYEVEVDVTLTISLRAHGGDGGAEAMGAAREMAESLMRNPLVEGVDVHGTRCTEID